MVGIFGLNNGWTLFASFKDIEQEIKAFLARKQEITNKLKVAFGFTSSMHRVRSMFGLLLFH